MASYGKSRFYNIPFLTKKSLLGVRRQLCIMVGLSGLGPPTSRLSSGRSNQLS